MKLNALGTTVILLVAFLPRHECRALESPGADDDDPQPQRSSLPIPVLQRSSLSSIPILQRSSRSSLPILQRLGEEYSIRLGHANSNSFGSSSSSSSSYSPPPPSSSSSSSSSVLMLHPDAAYRRALQQLQLARRLLEGRDGGTMMTQEGDFERRPPGEGSAEGRRGRRSDDPPISLDLTFHLLREMMEMSRAEQLALQAQNNRRMMEFFGK
ncbi:unnamed protein product [Merluccius merluccius]